MLTTARVRELKPRDKMYEVTCAAMPGFVVRVLPTGKKVFLVRRQVGGTIKREKLGLMSASFGVDEARRQAVLLLGDDARVEAAPEPVARPTAPKARRQVEPVKPSERRRPTVRELADRFAREFVAVYVKPSTATKYRRHLADYILPAIGDRDFETITRSDVQSLHASLRHIPSTANYVVNVVGSLYKRIITDWELSDMRPPTHGIKLFKMKVRERFLTPEERQRLNEATEAGLKIPPGRQGHLEPAGVWALQLLALTGMRRDEIRDLTWPMVDWQHACLRLPDTKTGQRRVPVSSQVVTLLRHIHDQTGNRKAGYVIASKTGQKLSSLNKTWNTLREALGIPEVRLHDLRHSFASDALMSGVPLAIVGEMLGHRQASTTMRYAHLADRVVREALEQTSSRIVAANTTVPATPIAPFTPLRDDQWAKVAPLVDADRPRGGKPVDLRRVVDGIRWALHNKARWRDLPAAYGKSTTCWRWYTRWCEDGTWPKIEAALTAPATTLKRPPQRPGSTRVR